MTDKTSGEQEAVIPPVEQLNPGDDAAPSTPGTGQDICPKCSGTGMSEASLRQLCRNRHGH